MGGSPGLGSEKGGLHNGQNKSGFHPILNISGLSQANIPCCQGLVLKFHITFLWVYLYFAGKLCREIRLGLIRGSHGGYNYIWLQSNQAGSLYPSTSSEAVLKDSNRNTIEISIFSFFDERIL